jgi:hypothetical protein
MAAGQIYDNGFGGAGRAPIGGVLNPEQFPDKLAVVTSAGEKSSAPHSRVRRALAVLGIQGVTAEQPAHSEQAFVPNDTAGLTEMQSGITPQDSEVGANTVAGTHEAPRDSMPPPNLDNRV